MDTSSVPTNNLCKTLPHTHTYAACSSQTSLWLFHRFPCSHSMWTCQKHLVIFALSSRVIIKERELLNLMCANNIILRMQPFAQVPRTHPSFTIWHFLNYKMANATQRKEKREKKRGTVRCYCPEKHSYSFIFHLWCHDSRSLGSHPSFDALFIVDTQSI